MNTQSFSACDQLQTGHLWGAKTVQETGLAWEKDMTQAHDPAAPCPSGLQQTLHSWFLNTSNCQSNGHPQHLFYSNGSTKCLEPQRALNSMSNPAQDHLQGIFFWSRSRCSPVPQHAVAAGGEASGWILVLYMTQTFKFCSNPSEPAVIMVHQKGLWEDPWHENMSFDSSLYSFTQ